MSGNSLTRAALGVGGLVAAGRALRKRRAISFRDKVVLITGGSRGLGLLIARGWPRRARAWRSSPATAGSYARRRKTCAPAARRSPPSPLM